MGAQPDRVMCVPFSWAHPSPGEGWGTLSLSGLIGEMADWSCGRQMLGNPRWLTIVLMDAIKLKETYWAFRYDIFF